MDKLVYFFKNKRTELGYTQAQMAEYLEIPLNTYKSYELGRSVPLVDKAYEICKRLNSNVEEIFSDIHKENLNPINSKKDPVPLKQAFEMLNDHYDVFELMALLPKDSISFETIKTVIKLDLRDRGIEFHDEDLEKISKKKA